MSLETIDKTVVWQPCLTSYNGLLYSNVVKITRWPCSTVSIIHLVAVQEDSYLLRADTCILSKHKIRCLIPHSRILLHQASFFPCPIWPWNFIPVTLLQPVPLKFSGLSYRGIITIHMWQVFHLKKNNLYFFNFTVLFTTNHVQSSTLEILKLRFDVYTEEAKGQFSCPIYP